MDEAEQSLPPVTRAFYRKVIQSLQEAEIPFLVGGAHAFAEYTGITRYTKDFDLFLVREDLTAALERLEPICDRTETNFAHWLGKAYRGEETIDLIFRTGNGIAVVDRSWIERAPHREVLGEEARICPPEEMLWTKAFIMERERYDGADVAHLLHACGRELDWPHLLDRFGEYWRVLLSHLILFQFIYPGARDRIPPEVMDELVGRLESEQDVGEEEFCRGPLLSRTQFRTDVQEDGPYRDARLAQKGMLSASEAERWTAAGEQEARERQ